MQVADGQHSTAAPDRATGSRAAARVTALVSLLAGVAVIDTISELARFAVDANDRLGWLRLTIGVLASVALSTWAFVRRQSRVSKPADAPSAPPSGPEAVDAIGLPRVSRSWRWLRWAAALTLLGIGAIVVAEESGTLKQALNDLHHLHWRWVRWSIYAEVGSILAFGWLWARLLRAGASRLSFGSIIGLTLAGNALLVSLPGGLAWSTTFSFNALRRRGVTRAVAARVLIVSSVLSILALVGLALVGVDLADATGPLAGLGPVVSGAAAALAVVAAATAVRMRRSGTLALTRARLTALVGTFSPRTLVAGSAAAVSNWILDGACLVGAILAVSGHVPWQGVLVAYAVGQLAENLPITPGGIGVVEGSLTVMLVAYGMHNSTALAAVLLYRLISFWLLVPIGWVAAAAIMVRGRPHRGTATAVGADGTRAGGDTYPVGGELASP